MVPTDMERGEGTSALAPHSALTARPRKMSIVPDTPTFAIEMLLGASVRGLIPGHFCLPLPDGVSSHQLP